MITKQTLFNESQAVGVEYDPDATASDNSGAHAAKFITLSDGAMSVRIPVLDIWGNPDATASDERTHYNLRTVRMPDLRSGECRTLDAAARGLDCRTADDKVRAELVRLVDALQALTLRVEMLEGVVTRIARSLNVPGVKP